MANITKKVQIDNIDIIRRLQEVKHMTTAELSKKSGISKNQILQIKKGKISNLAGMRLSTIRALSEAFDVTPSIFVKAPYEIEIEVEETSSEKASNEDITNEEASADDV